MNVYSTLYYTIRDNTIASITPILYTDIRLQEATYISEMAIRHFLLR